MLETTVNTGSPRYRNILAAVILLALSLILYANNTLRIEERIAYEGYGPQHYVNEKKHPQNYERDFIRGVFNFYDNSLPMRVYPLLDKHFGIDPSTVIYPYMYIQILLFLAAAAFLIQTLFKNHLFTLIALMATVVSSLSGMNLSIFGTDFGALLEFPLFYGYANAFRLLGIAFFIRNRFVASALMLGLSVYCHVNMGLFGIVFVSGFLLIRPRLLTDRRFLAGAGLLLVLVIPWLYSVMAYAKNASDPMPVEAWIKSTRIFCHHWYPFTMKLFTDHANRFFFPMLLIGLSGFIGLRYHSIKDQALQKILAGVGACATISVLGILFSDIVPVPLIIKISPQRSTDLITFFALLYTCFYLFQYLEAEHFWLRMAAVYALTVLFLSGPGFALLPLMILIFNDLREGWLGPFLLDTPTRKHKAFAAYALIAVLLILLATINLFARHMQAGRLFDMALGLQNHLWHPFTFFDPTGEDDFLIKGGMFTFLSYGWAFLFALSMSAALWFRPMREKIAGFQWSLLVSVAAFFYLFAWIQLRDFADRRAAGFKNESDYMAVQLWAKDHTPPDALFMPDPSILYGWRDFANRSSFGNIREWGFVAIAYTPDNAKYLEGKNRLKIFGIDIDGITEEQIRNSKTRVLGDQLVLQAKARFYSSTPSDIQALCDAYGIDYFIMEKKSLPAQRFKQMTDSFQTAFQNDSFIVFGRNTIQGMIDRYDQLLKTSPENVHLAFKLALIHHRLNNKDAAIKYYRQAIDGNPDFPEALSNLALLYFEMGNDQEAVRLYKQLIGIKPDDPEAHYNLACLTARGGMAADAVMYLEKAIRNGYNKYHLIRSDPDLNNIRGMDEYKRLMTEDRKQSADGGGKSSILEQ